jgi:MYND finger protein
MSADYQRIDKILQILYEKEINIDPADRSHVVRSTEEMIRNKAVNIAFWIKFDNHTGQLGTEDIVLNALAVNGREYTMRIVPPELRTSVVAELTRIRWDKRLVSSHDKCDDCGKLGCALRCVSCNYSFYCSKKCQKHNWVKEHKRLCKFLQKYYKPISEKAVNESINHKLQLVIGELL